MFLRRSSRPSGRQGGLRAGESGASGDRLRWAHRALRRVDPPAGGDGGDQAHGPRPRQQELKPSSTTSAPSSPTISRSTRSPARNFAPSSTPPPEERPGPFRSARWRPGGRRGRRPPLRLSDQNRSGCCSARNSAPKPSRLISVTSPSCSMRRTRTSPSVVAEMSGEAATSS